MGCRTSSSKGASFKARPMNQPKWQMLKPRIKRLQAMEDA